MHSHSEHQHPTDTHNNCGCGHTHAKQQTGCSSQKTTCASNDSSDSVSEHSHNDGGCCSQSHSDEDALTLAFTHHSDSYCYRAEQHFSLQDSRLDMRLRITNQGADPLPFGLGWHPFFPLSETTLLQANASGYWQEDAQWLAGKHHHELPDGLDFCTPKPLPRRWVNNGFSGWDGKAEIVWPESGHQLRLTTSPECPVFFLFISDSRFDPGYQHDFFCFEPMTHAANDHHLPQGGSLRVLSPGESLTQHMSLHSATINIPE